MKDPWDFDATPEELHQMAQTDRLHIRERVAKNPNTSPETLNLLASNPREEHSVRVCVAKHHNTPLECLTKMSQNGNLSNYVVQNPSTPPSLLAEIALGQHKWAASYYIVRNHATPFDIWMYYRYCYGRLPP